MIQSSIDKKLKIFIFTRNDIFSKVDLYEILLHTAFKNRLKNYSILFSKEMVDETLQPGQKSWQHSCTDLFTQM